MWSSGVVHKAARGIRLAAGHIACWRRGGRWHWRRRWLGQAKRQRKVKWLSTCQNGIPGALNDTGTVQGWYANAAGTWWRSIGSQGGSTGTAAIQHNGLYGRGTRWRLTKQPQAITHNHWPCQAAHAQLGIVVRGKCLHIRGVFALPLGASILEPDLNLAEGVIGYCNCKATSWSWRLTCVSVSCNCLASAVRFATDRYLPRSNSVSRALICDAEKAVRGRFLRSSCAAMKGIPHGM